MHHVQHHVNKLPFAVQIITENSVHLVHIYAPENLKLQKRQLEKRSLGKPN